jgi:hypothetical protein
MPRRRLGKGAVVESVLLGLAALACPVGMGVMMRVMSKSMRRDAASYDPAAPPSLEQLRAEHERLGAQIERLEGSDAEVGAQREPARR